MEFDEYRPIALVTILIGVTGIIAGPKSGFCLSVDRFFDYFIKTIKLPGMLFYFYPHSRFQIFLKVPNYCAFF